jgi:hypothetical protein
MKKHSPSANHENGFAHLGLILVIALVIGVTGFAGWRIYDSRSSGNAARAAKDTATTTAKSRETVLKENEEKILAPPEVQTPAAASGSSASTPTSTQTTTPPPSTPAATPAPSATTTAPTATPTSWITNPTSADCSRFESIPTIWMAKNDSITLYDPEGNAYTYQGTAAYRSNLTDVAMTIGYKATWGNNPQWSNKIECYQTGWLKVQNVSAPFYLKWSDVSITAPPAASCTGTAACQ